MEQEVATQVIGLGGSTDFSLMQLFLRADFIVKSVIIILIAASVYSWALIFEKYKGSRPTPIGTQVEPQFTSKKQSGSASAGSGLGWRPTSLDEGPELTRIRHSSTHPSVFSRPVWCYP